MNFLAESLVGSWCRDGREEKSGEWSPMSALDTVQLPERIYRS